MHPQRGSRSSTARQPGRQRLPISHVAILLDGRWRSLFRFVVEVLLRQRRCKGRSKSDFFNFLDSPRERTPETTSQTAIRFLSALDYLVCGNTLDACRLTTILLPDRTRRQATLTTSTYTTPSFGYNDRPPSQKIARIRNIPGTNSSVTIPAKEPGDKNVAYRVRNTTTLSCTRYCCVPGTGHLYIGVLSQVDASRR